MLLRALSLPLARWPRIDVSLSISRRKNKKKKEKWETQNPPKQHNRRTVCFSRCKLCFEMWWWKNGDWLNEQQFAIELSAHTHTHTAATHRQTFDVLFLCGWPSAMGDDIYSFCSFHSFERRCHSFWLRETIWLLFVWSRGGDESEHDSVCSICCEQNQWSLLGAEALSHQAIVLSAKFGMPWHDRKTIATYLWTIM